jgi:FdhD protein
MSAARPVEILRYENCEARSENDELAAEEPLEIRIEGRSLAVTMRTPGHDLELAAGFLLTEGVIRTAKDLFDITTCLAPGAAGKGNAVDAALTHPGSFDFSRLTRHVFTSSSCGLCSKATVETVLKRRKPLPADSLRVPADLLLALPRRLARHQETFRRTGGLHACALFDRQGKLLAVREDIGRHNALDKLIGWALLEKRTPLSDHVVLLSGRASFEMMQKAHAAGIPVVVAISAPSSLAVEFARESGQTLAGFVRGRSMNIYAWPERVTAVKKKTDATPESRVRLGALGAGGARMGARRRSSSSPTV